MPIHGLALASICATMLLAVPARGIDLKIVTRNSTNGLPGDTSTQYLSTSRSRFQSGTGTDNIGGHRIVTIVHYEGETNRDFTLDLDAREYAVHETDKRGIAPGAKSYSPKYTGGTLGIYIESVDTGERQEMFAHTARHIITKDRRVPGPGACSDGSESVDDGWYLDYSILPEWRRPHPGATGIVAGFSAGCRDNIQIHRSGVELGFPIRVATTYRSRFRGSEVKSSTLKEVIEFTEAPLNPALFEVPADFRQVDELTSMARAKN